MHNLKGIVTALAVSLMTSSCMADVDYSEETPVVQDTIKQNKETSTVSGALIEIQSKEMTADTTKIGVPTHEVQQEQIVQSTPAQTEQQSTTKTRETAEMANKEAVANQSPFSRVHQLLGVMRGDKDLMISEAGITELLSAIVKGAEGESKKQMIPFIPASYTAITNDAVYKQANLVYIFDKAIIKPSYLDALSHFAVAASLDALNQQVSKKTDGAIKRAIDKISPNTKLILSNVMTFAGKWQTPFKPEKTEQATFTALCQGKEKAVSVPMMRGDIAVKSLDDAVAIPFSHGYSMVIKLSDKKTRATADASQWLYADNGKHIKELLNQPSKTVMLRLPKFDLQAKHHLIPAMKQLGISDIFDKDKANLTKVSDVPLFVDQFQQVIKLTADESGAKASAVTTATMVSRSIQILPDFTVNRPFAFAIVKTATPDQVVLAGEIHQLTGCQ